MFHRKLFTTQYRVKKSWEYREIQQFGHKVRLKNFIVLYQVRQDGPVRLGLIVSRKAGGAVQRNRVKRLVREFFRQNRERLPPHRDFVIIAKRGAHKLSFLAVVDELASLFAGNPAKTGGGLCLRNR